MGAEFLAELPATAGRETRNLNRTLLRILFSSINRAKAFHVAIGKAGDSGDIVSGVNLGAIAAEVLDDVSSIAEVIHDVAEIAGVIKPQGVAEFVQTRHIDDAVAQQRVSPGATRNVRTERIDVRAYEDGRSLLPAYNDWARFPVLAAFRAGPIDTNESARFRCCGKSQAFRGVSLPCLQSPECKFWIR